jgi:hypothetical protein
VDKIRDYDTPNYDVLLPRRRNADKDHGLEWPKDVVSVGDDALRRVCSRTAFRYHNQPFVSLAVRSIISMAEELAAFVDRPVLPLAGRKVS